MHFDTLPSLDNRIKSWLSQEQKNEGLDPSSKYRFTITLSRQFGCEGYPLAVALKEELERRDQGQVWTIFDRALIDKILVDNQISRRVLENFGSKSVFYDSLMSSIVPNWTSDADVYDLMVKTMISLAEKGRAIFVGRGAAVVTQDMKRTFHFRLAGGQEYRIRSLMDRGRMTRDEVIQLMAEKEKEREKFINRFLGTDIASLEHYHLVLNNEKSSVDEMASTLLHHIELHMANLLK